MTDAWPLYDAKNKFSALVQSAREHGPQTVTKHGRAAVVVISVEEYERLATASTPPQPQAKLVDWLFSGPRAPLPGRPATRRVVPEARPHAPHGRWDT